MSELQIIQNLEFLFFLYHKMIVTILKEEKRKVKGKKTTQKKHNFFSLSLMMPHLTYRDSYKKQAYHKHKYWRMAYTLTYYVYVVYNIIKVWVGTISLLYDATYSKTSPRSVKHE